MAQNKLFLWTIFISSFAVALVSLRFIPLQLELAFPSMVHQIANAKNLFLLHIAASPIALALGAYQFFPNMRKRHLTAHRWVGRLYVLTVVIGGISGFLIAFEIEGLIGTAGFAALALLWIFTTVQAVIKARAKQIADHRIWMIRSFALTFAAVTLRLQLAIFTLFDMPYEQVYMFLAWSCWVPNLLFAMWWVSKNPRPPVLKAN